jgi:hypothetical protein
VARLRTIHGVLDKLLLQAASAETAAAQRSDDLVNAVVEASARASWDARQQRLQAAANSLVSLRARPNDMGGMCLTI